VTPDTDLTVVDLTRGGFLLIRCAAAFAGLLVGPVYVLIFAAFQVPLPVVVPMGVGLVLAVAGWLLPAVVVHGKAEARRLELRYALVSYLTLVALHRAAGQGMGASLELAAGSSSAWTFARIGQRIDSAIRSGTAPWDGLAGLATELGIDELTDLASIADVAGTAGGGVYSTLLARAKALRHELLAREEAAAAVMSARMVLPKALLGVVTLLFLLYPAVMLIGGT
jgi:Flp pilus assembly protein TadB